MENITNEQVENTVTQIDSVSDSEKTEQELSVDELKAKVAEYESLINESKQSVEQLEQTLKEREQKVEQLDATLEKLNLTTTLANEGLNEFQGLFDLETVEEKVAFLKKVKNDILVANSYQPSEKAKQDEYTTAIQNNDVKSAIGFKFSKLFGK